MYKSNPKYNDGSVNWLDSASNEFDQIDQEKEEENLPAIDPENFSESKIPARVANQPVAPVIYPTEDSEISINLD